MTPKVERVEEIESVELGEGPHWDEDSQSLYFVDIHGKSIHKYVPATKKCTKAVIGTNEVSLIIPVKGEKDTFLISIGRELAVITWDGLSEKMSSVKKLYEVDNAPGILDNRFNDGKCDPSGRLWAGTMGAKLADGKVAKERGSLFSFEKNKVTAHITNVGLSNGLAWNIELKKFYYIDTHRRSVDECDFDIKNGIISNRKPIFTLAKNDIHPPARPDGLTIDTDGNLWVAIMEGNRVIKIDPRRPETLLQTVAIPAREVSSVAFGGPKLDELYVTTGRFTIDEVLLPPVHGSVYKITGINAKRYPGVSVVL